MVKSKTVIRNSHVNENKTGTAQVGAPAQGQKTSLMDTIVQILSTLQYQPERISIKLDKCFSIRTRNISKQLFES